MRITKHRGIVIGGVVGAVACLVYLGVAWVGHQASKAQFNISSSVSARDWQSNPAYFCAGVKGLSPPQLPGTFILSTLVDSAPNAVAHAAAKTYYYQPTTANLAKVVAAYPCKEVQP